MSRERKLPPPANPLAVARPFVRKLYYGDGQLTLRHWRGGWWEWRGSHWVEAENAKLRRAAYGFTQRAIYFHPKHGWVDWAPNRNKVANLLEAVAAICHLRQDVDQPTWIQGEQHRGVIVACANGLLDVERRKLLSHTPRYFNQTAVPFAYELDAPRPTEWLTFLLKLWPEREDRQQIRALQEFFGYVVSGRLDQQKILLLVGPTRAGKGVIARVLGALVGPRNVAGPTLSSLKGDFGLAPLIGKPLAVVSDARLNGRDANVVVERLLSISGEDTLTVNRKFREQWTGKLPSRLFVASNELPRLGDASAAIAGRFVTLLLERSWIGQEDRELESRIHAELSGILNWSLDGLARLERQGRFTRPAATDIAFEQIEALASPIGVFIRELCVIGGRCEVPVDDLWEQWRRWCEDNGHHSSSKQTFGRDMHSRLPALRVHQQGGRDERRRVYAGIALRGDGDA